MLIVVQASSLIQVLFVNVIDLFILGLPPPRKLKLERQLNNSIVISWLAPENVGEDEIRGYSIKADGQLKETVIGSDKTKAIVSDVARDKVRLIKNCACKHSLKTSCRNSNKSLWHDSCKEIACLSFFYLYL